MTLLALGCAALSTLLLLPRRPALRSGRWSPWRGLPSGRPTSRWAATPLLGVPTGLGVGLLAGLHGKRLVLAGLVATAAVAAAALVRRTRRAAQAQRTRTAVTDYCEALLGELRAGLPVSRAVERAVAAWSASEPVAAAARLGADVPSAFRNLGERPGAGALRRVAAAFELCSATGAGLAFALEQVLETARSEETVERLARAELASARATARLVVALPLVVLVAADGAGGDPWHFLLDTGPGLGCLALGGGLAFLGLWWIDRIAAAAVLGEG